MGKTSIARELGQRLEADGWVFLFTDVEGATDPEDAVAGTGLLGASGQNDLAHYETRLRDGLDDESYPIAMQILAEAATREVFAPDARRHLESMYSTMVDDAAGRIADALDVLVHDGYLDAGDGGYRFQSNLLKDWWSARFRDHHRPLVEPASRTAR